MSNFNNWWQFCMQPQNDGVANDTADDGAGITRWGWTYSTWLDAMYYTGQAPSLNSFDTMTIEQAGALAEPYFWNRYGGPQLQRGCDVSVVDWAWNSGDEAIYRIQENLGKFYNGQIDGDFGPMTIAAIRDYGQREFINAVYTWRVSFLNENGFQKTEPGLYTRALNCRTLALSLTK